MMPDGKQTKMDWVKSLGAHRLINYKKQDWSEVLRSDEERFDMIFDTVGSNDDLAKAGAILKEGAPFVSIANFDPKIPEGAAFRFASFIVHSDGRDLAGKTHVFYSLHTFSTLSRSLLPPPSHFRREKTIYQDQSNRRSEMMDFFFGCGTNSDWSAFLCPTVLSLLPADLVTLVEQRKLSVLVDSVFEFEEAREALERSMTGRATGKIIVEVDDFFASERSFG